MADIDNNRLIGLLVIAGLSLLVSQEYIKQKGKQRKWLRLRIRKRDSKEPYYSIIYGLSLAVKEDFRKYLRINALAAFLYFYSIQIKIKTMCFYFFYMEQVDTIYQKVLYNSCCFCFYIMEFRKQKNIFCTSEALLCFTQKNNLCIMIKIKLV